MNYQTIPIPQTSLLSIEKSSQNINTTTGNINVTSCKQRMLIASITSNQKSDYKKVKGTKYFSQGDSEHNSLNKLTPYKSQSKSIHKHMFSMKRNDTFVPRKITE